MALERTSCLHRGKIFFGEFQVLDDGPDQSVRVRYRGKAIESKNNGKLAETLAHSLLHELVVQEAVALKVAGSDLSPQGASLPHAA